MYFNPSRNPITTHILILSFLIFPSLALHQFQVENMIITAEESFESTKYEPNWDSLDTRPLPAWYDEAKLGIFLHWGVYAVPGYGSEWFWYQLHNNVSNYVNFMKENYKPGFTYQDFGREFTAEFFDPVQWAQLFEKSGAKYVVLTSKHHEGYTLWPSKYSFGWNAKDVGPHRDLVGELATAVRNHTSVKFGLYHSLFEWFNPLFVADNATNFTTSNYVTTKALPEMLELIEKYRPEVLWSDGDARADPKYWQAEKFIAWLYNDSPVKDTIVVNDRWGGGVPCHHGDFYTCHDKYNPGMVLPHKWENCMTVDRNSWGYRRNMNVQDVLSTHELIQTLTETVSFGGNLLMNVGPTKEGLIVPIFQERLLEMGEWLGINGEAIYKSKPWTHQNDTNGYTWYTARDDAVYAINLQWPDKNVLNLGLASELFKSQSAAVVMLGEKEQLKWVVVNNAVHIVFPDKASVKSRWVWVLKIVP